MPRGRKRKRTASEVNPLADNGTTRDSNTDSETTRDVRDVGGPKNSTGEGGNGRTGNRTRTADSHDGSRATGRSAGRNDGSNDNEGTDSGGNSAGGHLPTPLTRDDIPALVREIARQFCLDDAEVHAPLVPGTMCCVSLVFPY